jgi:hypothetical protein
MKTSKKKGRSRFDAQIESEVRVVAHERTVVRASRVMVTKSRSSPNPSKSFFTNVRKRSGSAVVAATASRRHCASSLHFGTRSHASCSDLTNSCRNLDSEARHDVRYVSPRRGRSCETITLPPSSAHVPLEVGLRVVQNGLVLHLRVLVHAGNDRVRETNHRVPWFALAVHVVLFPEFSIVPIAVEKASLLFFGGCGPDEYIRNKRLGECH